MISWNPYAIQATRQDGCSLRDVYRDAKPACITDEEARKRGYDNAEAYEQALHDFLNSN